MTVRLFIILLTLLSLNQDKETVVFGKLVANKNPDFYNIDHVSMIIKTDNEYFDTVITNTQGEFSFSLPIGKTKNIDILYSGLSFRTIYLRHINSLTADSTKLTINIPIQYKKNIFGKAYCPKCGKADKTYKISYSDAPIYYSLNINGNGDTISSAIYKGKYQAGTCVSSAQSAQWYCDRNKIEF
jgi:hypothetical protein